MKMYWILIMTMALTACHKPPMLEDPDIDPPDDTTTISPHQNVVWQVAHTEDTTGVASYIPVIVDDRVVFVSRFNKPYDEVFACNKETGKVDWFWDNDFNRRVATAGGIFAHGSTLMITDGVFVYNVDGTTGKTRWYSENRGGSIPINVIGDYVYDNISSGGLEYDEAFLLRSPIHTPRWDTLYSITKAANGGLSPGLVVPSLWVHPGGDSILIFHGRDLKFSPLTLDLDLYAFNLRTCQLEWHHEDVGQTNLGTLHPPLIYNDKVYLKDSEHVMCFDAFTGDQIWVQGPMSGNAHCDLVIAEDKLFINPDGQEIMALDLETGAKVWHYEGREVPAGAENIVYYKGVLYTNGISGGSSRLHGFRASDGELIWTMDPTNRAD